MRLLDLPPEVLGMILEFWTPTRRGTERYPPYKSDIGEVLLTCSAFYPSLHVRFTNSGFHLRGLPEAETLATLIMDHEAIVYGNLHVASNFQFDRFAAFLNITALWFNFVIDANSPLSQLAQDAFKLLRLVEVVVNQVDYLTPVGGPSARLPFLEIFRVIAFSEGEEVSL